MDDELRARLTETAQAVAESPPSTKEVLVAGRRQRWRMRWAVAAVLLTASLLFVAVSYAGFYGRAAVRPFNVPLVAQPTRVPDVVGTNLGTARDRLDEVGLKAEPATPCERGDACRVEKQSLRPGVQVEKGTAVELRLVPPSPRLVAVPELVGLDRNAATEAVKDAGLKVKRDEQCDDATLPCRVADQSPAAGSEVRRGTAIQLVLRDGPLVTVPEVVGRSEAEARDALAAQGLVPGGAPCAAARACRVASQNPAAGKEVVRETRVTLELEEIADTTVPGVVGLPSNTALAKIERAQLKAEVPRACEPALRCEVATQSLTPRTIVEVGTTIVLTLRVVE